MSIRSDLELDVRGLGVPSPNGQLTMTRSPGPIYESACHEGSYALSYLLSGYRASER